MNLTPDQRRAVERTGQNVCVVAGPGAGKTRVLIERFAWLVERREADPARILAITFTEKAATEIKQRLVERFVHRADLREAIERAWVSTIDGFCARLLRENAIAAGIAPDFEVLDPSRAEQMERESAEGALDALFAERPSEMRRLLEALDLSTQDDGRQPDLARSLLTAYDATRVSGARELPSLLPASDAHRDACDLLRTVLADATTGKTANQLIAHKRLKEWAAEFLSMPASPVTIEHFEVLKRFTCNLGHLVKNSASRDAAAAFKNTIFPRLESQFLEGWNQGLHELLRLAVQRIDATYRAKKRRDAVLDFGDLEEQAIALLESDTAFRQETASRFDQVLMDELQDTNRLQWRLLDLLTQDGAREGDDGGQGSRRNFFAVGDINQSIYGFRHAEPAVFEEYRHGLQTAGAVVDDLRENHRSRPEILAAVSRVLDGQPGIEPRPLIASRECKAEFKAATDAGCVERLVGRGDQAAEVEAGLVAARVLQLVTSRQCDYSDIAILVRTLGALEPFEQALEQSGIPFLVSGGRMFLEARETRDLLALLAALVNPLDDIALVGVLRSPLAGISDEEIFHLGPEGRRGHFARLFGHLRPLAGFISPDRLLVTALDESGYLGALTARARGNIEKFLAWTRREFVERPRPLAELLADLEALRATQSEAEAPPPEAGNVVRLMSIHAAKGLEFPVVFVSALHRGPDRRRPVIAFSTKAGLGAKWRNPVTGKGQSDTAHATLMDELKRHEDAEENRLLYVAMTRAEDRLILSYAERSRPSPWQKLAEAGIPMMTAAEEAPEISPAVIPTDGAVTEELIEAPEVDGQYDSNIAVTSIALFHACPRKYYLGRYLGLADGMDTTDREETAGGETDATVPAEGLVRGGMALGSAVHAVLSGAAAEADGGISDNVRELAARFQGSEIGQRAARAPRVEKEFDFLLDVEGMVVRGQIDLWFEEAGELVVVDYKTDRDVSDPSGYALQLRLYALALERYAGRLPDRAVIFYLRSGRAVEVSLSREGLSAARATVGAIRDAQESLKFPMNVGEQCRGCGYRGATCPAEI